jgi:hypothetical protein
MFETMESRTMFAATAVTPPPPPPVQPKPGITLTKGQLVITANPKVANNITVLLSKDGKNIDVSFDGKNSAYPVKSVTDVQVHGATPADKTLVDLSAIAPKPAAGKTPPPPPATGVTLKNGLLTITDAANQNNGASVVLSKDGKSVDVSLNGKTTVFSATSITNVTVVDGSKNDTLLIALGSLKLKNPVLVHGGFGSDTITGIANYDLPLAPPPAA